MVLNYNQWQKLNEENIFSRISDWFENKFGRSYKKIKKLLEEYEVLEKKFVDEFTDATMEMDKLELKREQTQNDPAEQKTIQRFISRNRELVESMEKSHSKSIEYLMKRVQNAIGEEQKLKNFWEMNKSKIDAQVAEEMYTKSKQLADTKFSDSLYKKYKLAVDNARQKDLDFKEKYGSIIKAQPFFNDDITPSPSIALQEPQVDLYSTMSLADFTVLLKGMTQKELKTLSSALIKQRNEFYVKLEMEREIINKQIDRKEISREESAKRIKAVREMYMDKIRDLRSKITVSRQYA